MWDQVRQLATKHVTMTVSLSLAILAVLRALYFARFDLPVAFAVLALTNQATLLITTLAMFLIVGVAILWVFDPGGHVNRMHDSGASRGIVFGTTIAVSLALPLIYSTFMSPIVVALAVLAFIVIFVKKLRRARQRKRRHKFGQKYAAWVAGLASAAVLAAVLGQPWMPSEQITTQSPNDVIVGYIVGDQAGQLFLLDRNREPVWIEVSHISSREVCQINLLPADLRWITTPISRIGSKPARVECFDT